MIPYDDLVIALAAWRANQGLPVVNSSLTSGAPASQPIVSHAPPRGTPPAPPGRGGFAANVANSPPHETVDIDEVALIDESYEEAGDFAIPFNQPELESTAIGLAPLPPHGSGGTQRGEPAEPDPITENRPPVKYRDDW